MRENNQPEIEMKMYKPSQAGQYLKNKGMDYVEARELIDASTPTKETIKEDMGIEFVVREWSEEDLDKLLASK